MTQSRISYFKVIVVWPMYYSTDGALMPRTRTQACAASLQGNSTSKRCDAVEKGRHDPVPNFLFQSHGCLPDVLFNRREINATHAHAGVRRIATGKQHVKTMRCGRKGAP